MKDPATIEYLKNLAIIIGTVLLPVVLAITAPFIILATKIGVVVAAVGTLIYAIKKLAENWDVIGAAFSSVGESIQATFDNIQKRFISMKDFIVNGIKELGNVITNGVNFLIPDFIQNAFKGPSASTGTMPSSISNPALNNSGMSGFNNTSNNKVNITINADSTSNGEDIATKSAEAVRKIMEEERRATFEAWRQVAPAGAL